MLDLVNFRSIHAKIFITGPQDAFPEPIVTTKTTTLQTLFDQSIEGLKHQVVAYLSDTHAIQVSIRVVTLADNYKVLHELPESVADLPLNLIFFAVHF